jgi:PTS system mannitol-specific IIC component
MGQAVLKRKLAEAKVEIAVSHCALSELKPSAALIVTHRSLAERVHRAAPGAEIHPVDEFIHTPVYEHLIASLRAARDGRRTNFLERSDANRA